jgi:hypothetical protein
MKVTGLVNQQIEHARRQAERAETPRTGGWDGSAAGGGLVTQFRYKSMGENHIVCREFDGTTEGTSDVLIAKPLAIRQSYAGGVTATYTSPTQRTVSGQAQTVFPPYRVDDLIYAARSSNGVGVSVSSAALDWVELPGRTWVEACSS